MAQRAAAQDRVNKLSSDELTTAAIKADSEAATAAAKAGKAIPTPSALPKLEQDRATAAHALAAQQAAFAIIEGECDEVASTAYWAGLEKTTAAREAMRTQLAAKAQQLGDAVEAAVDDFTVFDWLSGGVYDRTVKTWPCDVVDLERFNLTRKTTTPVDVRTILVAAATTALEDPEK